MQGWIKLHREMRNHWIWQEDRKFSYAEAWIDLILLANHKPNKVNIKGKLLYLERGELARSTKGLGETWKWSKSRVSRFLKTLEKDGMIRYKNETVTSRITICNYDDYQSRERDDESHMKRSRNGDETHLGTDKNVKNEKNVKEAKSFYDLEISSNEKTAMYKQYVNDLFSSPYSNDFLLLNEQVSYEGFNSLIDKCISKKLKLSDQFKKLLHHGANKPSFYSGKSSAYLTLASWIDNAREGDN